jgi:hypothetical protein
MDVPQATFSPARDNNLLAVVRQVAEQLVALANLRTKGNVNRDVSAALTVFQGASSVAAALGCEARPMRERRQRIQATRRAEDDVTATSAVATVRPAARDVLLTAKADDTIATSTGAHENTRLIDEGTIRQARFPPEGEGFGSRTYIVQTLFLG